MGLFDRINDLANQLGDLIVDATDEIRAHIELGAALLERGDYDAAIRELRLALEKRRDHARALLLLGVALGKRQQPGDLDEARRSLRQALVAREGYAEAFVALGDLERRAGDPDAAAESYRAALPLLGDAHERAAVERALGATYLLLGQLDKAVRELRKAVSAMPEDAAAQGLLGQALVQSAQKRGEPAGGPTYEAARQCLLRASKSERPDAQVLATLGAVLLQAGQVPDSEKALARALELAPGDAFALLTLGKLRLAQGDSAGAYEQGLRAYAAASQAGTPADDSLRAEIHALLARCHKKSGSPERALAAFREALALLPGDSVSPAVLTERAAILEEALHLSLETEQHAAAAELGRLPPLDGTPDGLAAQAGAAGLGLVETEALLQRALQLGDTAEVRLSWAALEARKGNRAAAAAHLRRAAAIAPGEPRTRQRLGELYEHERAQLPTELYGLLQRAHRHFAQSPELAELSPEAGKLVETLDRPLLVTVMGEFNSGKSTFVNALLGEEVAPMGITPTTATINLLKYGRERGGRVVYRDGTSRSVRWSEVPALLRGLDPAEAKRISVVEVLYPLDVLQRVNVVDTPGLNSIQPEHEATAREFIAQADAVVWLFTVDQAGKASEREALGTIRAAGKQILGVLNKIDKLPQMASSATALETDEAAAPARDPLAAILAHLRDTDTGLVELLEVVVPFSGREALLGRKNKDADQQRRANLPALEQALEERFFARSQAIKHAAARARLHALLERARAHAAALASTSRQGELEQMLRLSQADALLFLRDFVPAERRRLVADADTAHRAAARETLDFVRPRRWPFSEHQAAPADRDFLLALLDEKLLALTQASRARVVEALQLTAGDAADPGNEDLLRLLDEQVFGRYRAFSRGYLRGGKVDDFFVRVLPRLEQLSEAAIGRALERDSPTAVDILEVELLTPLRAFGEACARRRAARLEQKLAAEELRRLDIEERVLFPLDALQGALAALASKSVPPAAA